MENNICVWTKIENYPDIKHDIADTYTIKTDKGIVTSGVFFKDKVISSDTTLGKPTHWLKEVNEPCNGLLSALKRYENAFQNLFTVPLGKENEKSLKIWFSIASSDAQAAIQKAEQ